MIEFTHLKVFLAASEEDSFSRAAEQLHLSQSAVSQNIHALERTLGVTLFLRKGRSVQLTEAGQAMVPLAREALHQVRLMTETLNVLDEKVVGDLELGCSTTSGKYLLPGLAAAFRQAYPEVHLRVNILSRQAVMERLLDERVALGVVSKRLEHPPLEYQPFFEDRIILIAPRHHPWAEYGRALPADLPDQPLIMREPQAGTAEVVWEALAPHGLHPEMFNVVMEVGNAEAIAMAVEEGIGLAFVSELVAARGLALGQIRQIEVVGLDLRRTIYLVRNTQAMFTRAHTAFWNFLQQRRAGVADLLARKVAQHRQTP